MKDFIDYKKLERLSEADKNVPLYKKIIKLQEEVDGLLGNQNVMNGVGCGLITQILLQF